jgi:hypothetical protein
LAFLLDIFRDLMGIARFYDLGNKKLIKTRDALFLDQDTPRHAKRARAKLFFFL